MRSRSIAGSAPSVRDGAVARADERRSSAVLDRRTVTPTLVSVGRCAPLVMLAADCMRCKASSDRRRVTSRTTQGIHHMPCFIRTALALLLATLASGVAAQASFVTPHPILFITAFPIKNDFGSIGSVFGNHSPQRTKAGRGGDLWIRYRNGDLRNITRELGYGVAARDQTGSAAIAVRDASVHWDATRALFSMTSGALGKWQIHEVSGPGLLTPDGALSIRKFPGQPSGFNNIEPTFGSDGSVIFTSDRPRNGAAHLYPQLDEYESAPTVTGLWKLDPDGSNLRLMNHLPSGAFGPFVDSFGRVVFTRWDHMERDQQEGSDTFNWPDESNSGNTFPSTGTDVFPEHKFDPLPGQNDHSFNFFFPWEINQDGTEEEVLNHLGRHELANFFMRRLTTDNRLVDFFAVNRTNPISIDDDGGMLQIAESPRTAGCYIATDSPEFGYHASGVLLRWCATPATNPNDIALAVVTANGDGRYRDAVMLDNAAGQIVASHTTADIVVTDRAEIEDDDYKFRLKLLVDAGGGRLRASAQPLTDDARMTRDIAFGEFDFNEPLWELSPVEVRVRPAPPMSRFHLAPPEQAAFTQTGVDAEDFRQFLAERGLGVIVVRDATARDRADRQQPFNLRVPGGRATLERNAQGNVVPGTIYDIASMQFLQGDQVRGWINPSRGRRVIARTLHDATAMAENDHALGTPGGSVPIEADGSVALYVPARRALAWQTLGPAPQHTPVVLERYWLTLQPGEIRACDGCHGVNQQNQARQPASTQTAQALVELLQRWRAENPQDRLFRHGFEG
jgi:hypothetical protein